MSQQQKQPLKRADGNPGRPPVLPNIQVADIGSGGLLPAVGILAAIVSREWV